MALFSQLVSAFKDVNAAAGRLKLSRLISDAIAGDFVQSLVAPGPGNKDLTSGTPVNVTSVSLPAGDWDVEATVTIQYVTATQTNDGVAGVNTTSATIPSDGTQAYSGLRLTTTSVLDSITLSRQRISLSSTTTLYLVAEAFFSAGSAKVAGLINARRVR